MFYETVFPEKRFEVAIKQNLFVKGFAIRVNHTKLNWRK
jgi:hypothetical protein